MRREAAPERQLILLVEDEPGIAKLLGMLLEECGYDVLLAANGRQGLELLDQAVPDLIITDYMMPEMNGAEFCRAYQARVAQGFPRGPVIMISALLPAHLQIDQLADAFIEKPGSMTLLLDTIERLLDNDR